MQPARWAFTALTFAVTPLVEVFVTEEVATNTL
jgi:hypothetical protein